MSTCSTGVCGLLVTSVLSLFLISHSGSLSNNVNRWLQMRQASFLTQWTFFEAYRECPSNVADNWLDMFTGALPNQWVRASVHWV